MKNVVRAAFVGAAACAAAGFAAGSASATPPSPHPEPGGVIRLDLAPGESWTCAAYSLQAPYVQFSPGYFQYTQGPAPIYFRFTPGADVIAQCNGTALPLSYFSPIVKAGI